MKINLKRLMASLETYASYGIEPGGGITRTAFNAEDYRTRDLFAKELEQLGMAVHIDAIANIWGTLQGIEKDIKPIAIGSHLDTVRNGGKFDGALGVLTAMEIVRTLQDHGHTLRHPLQIVSFTAEESNDFNFSTLGSRAVTGKLTIPELLNADNGQGLRLHEAVAKAGGNIDTLAPLEADSIAAFFELHIEQGRKLEKQELPIGIVERIVGIYRDIVTVTGEQNHSGTTMMTERKDALVAAGEMVAAVHNIAKQIQSDAVATVGRFEVFPNATNIIPGEVVFTLEVRSANKLERESLVRSIYQAFDHIKASYGVSASVRNIQDTQECVFDPDLMTLLERASQSESVPYSLMPSMAGHDAMHMASKCKTAMLFVKSINGISHSPEERSAAEDIEKSANVLLNAILLADEHL